MSKANSPRYLDGLDDGNEDALALSQCPPAQPFGPRPLHPAYPVMYMTGYNEAFKPQPCPCDGSCKAGKPYGWLTEQQRQQETQQTGKR